MFQSYALTTQRPSDRFGYFESVVDELFCPMQIEPRDGTGARFDGRIEATQLGSVRLARVATSPCIVHRRPGHIARIADAPYLVKFQLKGEALWEQRNRQVLLRPGDFVVVSTAEPYRLEFRSEYETPVLALSAATMRRLTRDPDQFLGIRMSGEDADCGLLSSFVGQAVSRMHRLREPMISRVEANILDLLGAVLTARETPGVVGAPQQRARIQAFIREHLRDRSLGPATIASAFGVSTRHVHALFEEEPMTVARLIRHERVHACRRALEAGPHDASLTDLALSWGFYDLSHMTRSFREEFGMTPRDVRAAAARLAYAPPSEDAAL